MIISLTNEKDEYIGYLDKELFYIEKPHYAYKEIIEFYKAYDFGNNYIKSSTDFEIAFNILAYYSFFKGKNENTFCDKPVCQCEVCLGKKVICERCGDQYSLFSTPTMPFLCDKCNLITQAP